MEETTTPNLMRARLNHERFINQKYNYFSIDLKARIRFSILKLKAFLMLKNNEGSGQGAVASCLYSLTKVCLQSGNPRAVIAFIKELYGINLFWDDYTVKILDYRLTSENAIES